MSLRSHFARDRKVRPPADVAESAPPQPPGDDEPRYRPVDWRLAKRILSRLAPYRKRCALGIALGVMMVTLEMQAPLFVKALITRATPANGANGPPGEVTVGIVKIIGLWAIVQMTALLLQRATILIMVDAGERVQFDLRRDLFAHLQRLSMSYYDRTRLGRIISRCTSDVASLREINVWGIDTVVKNLLMMLAAGAMLLHTAPTLFLAVVWLAPVLYIANRIYRHRIGDAYQRVREGFTRVSANLAENITGVRVVTAFDRQSWNLGVFNRLQEINTGNALRAARINGAYQPLLQFIGLSGKIIILLFGGFLVVNGRIGGGVGSVVAAYLYWDWFMGPILTFGNFHNQLMAAMAGAERVFDLLDTQAEVVDLPDAIPLPRIHGHVAFDHVTFGYKPDRPVLHDVSFEASPGEMIALVGATGAGKSSIVSLIARFYQPQQGRVLVDGHDIRHVTGESLHRQTGIVLQSTYLFTGTVADNIRHARPDAADADVAAAVRELGITDIIEALPDGLATQVGERGASLSLGQRQLICFARAYLADPRIFLLDEATSSIDSATELVVQRSLERLRAGRTTFVVAHRLSTIREADCILVIDDGRIVERGTHESLLREGGRYARLHAEFCRPVH